MGILIEGGLSIIALTIIGCEWESVLPNESVTVAVITCEPTDNDEFMIELPIPIRPSSSDVQVIRFEISPSSGSDAEPEKVIGVPSS